MRSLKDLFAEPTTRDAFLWWLGSRVSILLIFFVVRAILPDRVVPHPTHLYDAEFYIAIAERGYEWNRDLTMKQNVGFFPLLPMVMKAIAVTGVPADIGGTILNNLLFLVALIVLSRVRGLGLSRVQWNLFHFLICFHPSSFFFSIPYTETLFLLIAALIFFFVERRGFAQCAALAFLAGLVRSNGWIIGASLLAAAVMQRKHPRDLLQTMIVAGCGFAGTAAFLLFCQIYLGDWSATMKAQLAWGHKALHFHEAFVASISGIVRTGELTYWRVLLDALWMVATFAIAVVSLVKRRFTLELRIFAIMSAAFPLIMLGGEEVRSTVRYSMVIFPTLAQLAIWGEKRKWLAIGLGVLWVALFVFFTGRVLLGEWVQ